MQDIETFDPLTSYPVWTCDEQGNNKWVAYWAGDFINDSLLTHLCPFENLDEGIKSMILDNINPEDVDAVKSGEAYSNPDITTVAILYGD